jgi:1-acyl-sn-glycerol-3-phosphate acyltransferase
VRRLLVATFRRIVRLYFRQIERVGEAPSAETRGRLFVSNHHNALVDPILVLTDTDCEISPIAKSTLWSIPGLKYLLDAARAVPIVRRRDVPGKESATNDATFDRIAEHLVGGGNILIFPEGTSHSEPRLAPLRSGAARMLAVADERTRDAVAPLTFQAAALEFDNKSTFRSRCLVLWGPVRRWDDVAGDGEDRIRAATAIMEADLKELLVEGDSHEERRLIARVAEMLANDAGDASLEGWNSIGRQVELASQTLRHLDPATVAYVDHAVTAYYDELDRLGLRDARVATRTAEPQPVSVLRWVRRAALAPLAATGIALYVVPYYVPRIASRKTDHDAVSTIKLGAGLLAYPIWAAGLITAAHVLLPPPVSTAATVVILVSPFVALRWLDWRNDRDRPVSPEQLAAVAELRAAAIGAIREARASL